MLKEIIILVAGAALGSVITMVLIWAQQFGNTALSKTIREELDRKRASQNKQ